MTGTLRPVWTPGSLTGAGGVAESIAAKDLNNLYRTSCFFADADRYQAFCGLYAVMRLVDDRIDNHLAGGLDPEGVGRERRALDAWDRLVAAATAGGPLADADLDATDEPRARDVLEAFGRGITRFPTPPELWAHFFEAMREDLTRDRFQTFDAFLNYARGATVAPTTVYLYLIAADTDADGVYHVPANFDLRECGRNLGLFAYIGHVLRDLRKDLATGTRGLIYLAADDMATHGVSEAMLRQDAEAGHAGTAVTALVRDLAGRARARLRDGRHQLKALDGRLSADRAFILRLIVELYTATIEKLASSGYDPMAEQHDLTDREKERLALAVAGGAGAVGS